MTEPRDHLVGGACFTADLRFPGEAHATLLRSPHAHAEIESLDTRRAAALPGVLAIFTVKDLDAAGIGLLPCVWPVEQADGSPMVLPPYKALADGRARRVGEGIAFLVAETADAALAAAELIEVSYRALPAVADAEAALKSGAPQVWPEAPGNVAFRTAYGDKAATEAAFAQAERVVRRRLRFPRVVVNPMENRAAIAVPEGEGITLYTHSQGAQYLRELLLGALGWPAERLHVVSPDVGGAFGIRGLPYPEQMLTAHAAAVLGRPVRWIGERSSDGFLGDCQARDQSFDIALALDGAGRFLGIRLETVANLGAYITGYGPLNSTFCEVLPGPYDIPAGYAEVTGVFTNTVSIDAYRGAGRAELVYPLELLVDAAAHETGIDPVTLRRRNLATWTAPQRRNCFGREFAARDYSRAFELAAEAAAALPTTAAGDRRVRGLGLATYAINAMGLQERIRLDCNTAGRVVIHSGTQNSGQGHDQVFRTAVSKALGLPFEAVSLVQGDTRVSDISSSTAGSRSIPAGEPACREAAAALVARGTELAAQLWQAAPEEVSYEAGRFRCTPTGAELGLGDLVASAATAGLLGETASGLLTVEGSHDPGEFTEPCGTHFCEVALDPETGTVSLLRYQGVDDIGRVVAPALALAQVQGGTMQGIGQALMEHCHYDAESGQLLAGSFMDYQMPRAADAPAFSFSFVPASDDSVLHGLGEMGTVAATPTVLNAVNDALRRLGKAEIDAPATPERVWRACNS